MNIPMELIAALVTLFGGATLACVGFTYRKLTQIEVRLARLESRLEL